MSEPRYHELIDYQLTRYDSKLNALVEDHKFTSIECFLDINLNGKRLTTSFCSPGDHADLVTGMLAQMGKIRTKENSLLMSRLQMKLLNGQRPLPKILVIFVLVIYLIVILN